MSGVPSSDEGKEAASVTSVPLAQTLERKRMEMVAAMDFALSVPIVSIARGDHDWNNA